MASFIYLSIYVLSQVILAIECNTKLSVIAFVSSTGSNPTDGALCRAAMQVAVDAVNRNHTILPHYEIEPVFRDEGSLAQNAPSNLMGVFESPNSSRFLAPVVVGTYYACQTISGIVRQYNMVQFATWCAGTMFTGDRRRFPNLYRRSTAQEGSYAALIYLTKFLAKWKQVGIVYYPGNSNEFLLAKVLYQTFEAEGISVVWFASVFTFEDTTIISSLTASSARVVYLALYEPTRLLSFICLAYREGVRAPRYSLIAYSNAYSDPMSEELQLPKGCTRQMVLEQMDAIIWIGNFDGKVIKENRNSSLGYDIVEFKQRLGREVNLTVNSTDYSLRFNCHDAMLHALVSLDDAEKRLQVSRNMTLRDFQTSPQIVMEAVNRSAATVRYEGLQQHLWYSPDRLEPDHRFQSIVQYRNKDKSLHLLWRFWFKDNLTANLRNLSHYGMSKFEDINWRTSSGNPTKDLSVPLKLSDDIPPSLLWAFTGLAAFLSFVLVLLFVFLWLTCGTYGITDFVHGNLLLNLGAIGCNAACVLFVLDKTALICSMQLVITTLSACFVGGVLFAKLFMVVLFSYNQSQAKKSRTPSNIQQPSRNGKKAQIDIVLRHMKDRTALFKYMCWLFPCLNLGAVFTWSNLVDGMRVVEVHSTVTFDDKIDSYFYYSFRDCRCQNQRQWEGSLLALNFAPLVVGFLLTFDLRTHSKQMQQFAFLQSEISWLCFAATNAFGVFVVGVFSSNVTSYSLARSYIWACGLLIFGNATAFLSAWPLVVARYKGDALKARSLPVSCEIYHISCIFSTGARAHRIQHESTSENLTMSIANAPSPVVIVAGTSRGMDVIEPVTPHETTSTSKTVFT